MRYQDAIGTSGDKPLDIGTHGIIRTQIAVFEGASEHLLQVISKVRVLS